MSAPIARFFGPVACALACVALAAPASALAGGARSSHSPSAQGLWQAYPLKPRTRSSGTSAAPAPARTATPAPHGSGAGATMLKLLLFLAVVGLAVGAAAIALHRKRASLRSSAARARVALRPSDPGRGWTAEIEWQPGESDSRFWVMASADGGSGRTPVAQSAALEWPPIGPTAVNALSDAARAIEEALLSAGWAPLPAGDAWYAKRFRWEPRPASARPATAEPAAGPTEGARQNGAPPPARRLRGLS